MCNHLSIFGLAAATPVFLPIKYADCCRVNFLSIGTLPTRHRCLTSTASPSYNTQLKFSKSKTSLLQDITAAVAYGQLFKSMTTDHYKLGCLTSETYELATGSSWRRTNRATRTCWSSWTSNNRFTTLPGYRSSRKHGRWEEDWGFMD